MVPSQASSPVEKKQELDIFQQIEQTQQHEQRFPILGKILDNNIFNFIIMILTLFALFGTDMKVISFDKSADIYFDVVSIMVLVVFSTEIILGIISRPDYLFSFFFWLDLISTLSLILDIQMISTAIGLTQSSATNTAQLARAGRASRIGTRAGRVIRLVRLIRIVKLYKAAQKQNKKVKIIKAQNLGDDQNPDQPNSEKQSYDNLRESRVSKRLSDLTTKRVIIIVLLLLLVMPLFQSDYYFDPPKTLDFSLTFLRDFSQTNSTRDSINKTYNQVIDQHKDIESPLAFLHTPLSYLLPFQTQAFLGLRDDDIDISLYSLNSTLYLQLHPNDSDQLDNNFQNFIGVLNQNPVNVKKAILSICKTIFVCIVLSLGALLFSKDANDLALRPIERMIEKVKQIAKNPITVIQFPKQQATEQNLVKEGGANQYETVLIENAIIKIGTLLALGFGDAGSEIIAQNMARSGDVDPMLPGKKKCAIYGFCDIRNFTDATEVLQEDVMIFVNNIAEIVHSMVDRFAGAANKNIGDAFLLVWKIPETKYQMEDNGVVVWKCPKYIEQLSDCSIISFLKIICKINRDSKILKYRQDERLQKRMKGYKVKMGFGLHIGWGIEGAIGSEFKIDASYLSPNVNLAARLEAATKQYGVPLLISHNLEACCSEGMRKFTRKIDIVTVKGSRQPMGLFTIDTDSEKLPCSKDPIKYDLKSRPQHLKDKKLLIQKQIEAGYFSGGDFMIQNKDIKLLMQNFDQKQQDKWQLAFKSYIEGDWLTSKKMIEDVLQINPYDGPSKTIMEVISELNFQSPKDWPGYRELTEK